VGQAHELNYTLRRTRERSSFLSCELKLLGSPDKRGKANLDHFDI